MGVPNLTHFIFQDGPGKKRKLDPSLILGNRARVFRLAMTKVGVVSGAL
jgi:hypothetical protein